MDNPNFSMISEDIDDRLARFDKQLQEGNEDIHEDLWDHDKCRHAERLAFDRKKRISKKLSKADFVSVERESGKKVKQRKELDVCNSKLINKSHKMASNGSRSSKTNDLCPVPPFSENRSESVTCSEYPSSTLKNFDEEFSSKQRDKKHDQLSTDFSVQNTYDKSYTNRDNFTHKNSYYESKKHRAKQGLKYDTKSESPSFENIVFKGDSANKELHISRHPNSNVKFVPDKDILVDAVIMKTNSNESNPKNISVEKRVKQQFKPSEYLDHSDDRFLHFKEGECKLQNAASYQINSANPKQAFDYVSDEEEYFNPYLGCKQKWAAKKESVRRNNSQNHDFKQKEQGDSKYKDKIVSVKLSLKRRAYDNENVSSSKDLAGGPVKCNSKYILFDDFSGTERKNHHEDRYRAKHLKSSPQSRVKSNVWIREQNAFEEEACTSFSNDGLESDSNFHITSNANTFTMHDARKLAPLFLESSENEAEDSNSNILNADQNNSFRTKRKCWSKTCWSTTIHSHVSSTSNLKTFSEKHRL